MRLFARLFSCLRLALLALILSHVLVLAAERSYRNDDLASSAVRLEKKLNDYLADLRAHSSLTDLRNQANSAVKPDPEKRLPLLGAIAAAAPDSSKDWLALALVSQAAAAKNRDDPKR